MQRPSEPAADSCFWWGDVCFGHDRKERGRARVSCNMPTRGKQMLQDFRPTSLVLNLHASRYHSSSDFTDFVSALQSERAEPTATNRGRDHDPCRVSLFARIRKIPCPLLSHRTSRVCQSCFYLHPAQDLCKISRQSQPLSPEEVPGFIGTL